MSWPPLASSRSLDLPPSPLSPDAAESDAGAVGLPPAGASTPADGSSALRTSSEDASCDWSDAATPSLPSPPSLSAPPLLPRSPAVAAIAPSLESDQPSTVWVQPSASIPAMAAVGGLLRVQIPEPAGARGKGLRGFGGCMPLSEAALSSPTHSDPDLHMDLETIKSRCTLIMCKVLMRHEAFRSRLRNIRFGSETLTDILE